MFSIRASVGLAFSLCAASLVPQTAAAEEQAPPKGVVELFTSQGCSSCPAADAALGKLVREGEVVALSYHVDYWNFLGWEDTLASEENTARQYAYSRMLGRNSVYTPQAVLNGRDHANGADLQTINSQVDEMKAAGKGLTVPVNARLEGDEIKISVGGGQGKAVVLVAYFQHQQSVKVEDGENSGKQISYWNAVSDVQTIGMWDGAPAEFVLPASVLRDSRNSGCAVLVQRMKDVDTPGPILGAATVILDVGPK